MVNACAFFMHKGVNVGFPKKRGNDLVLTLFKIKM